MKVSVALCTYNGEKYIHQQLDSILKQSKEVDEIIVCDDLSQDNTYSILENYQSEYPQVFRIFKNDQNLGYVKNFEKALSLCTGDIIFLADQDDIWLSEKVEETETIFAAKPNIDVVIHNLDLFSEELHALPKTYWDVEQFNPSDYSNSKELLERILFKGNVFPGMSMALKQSFVAQHLPLKSPSKNIIHDYELILLALNSDSLYLTNKILGQYRIHSNQNIGFNKVTHEERPTSIEIGQQQVFARFKQHKSIANIVNKLALDNTLIQTHKMHCLNLLDKFLKSFSIPNRWYVQLKMNYYYKVKNYLQP